MIVITGASGNTGSVAADALLAQGQKVRVVGRNAAKLERFAKKGADVFVGDVADADAMTRAFTGASAVYAMIPPNAGAQDFRAEQERISDALTAAIRNAGVTHVVALSSVGAHLPERTGPILGLRSFEQKLRGITGLNALILRPVSFMENLLVQVNIIQMFGMLAGAHRADLKEAMIATRDIGAVAAQALARRVFKKVEAIELLGERDVTMVEAATIIGNAIGKPDLAYMQLPDEQVRGGMMQMGLSASYVDLILEMIHAMNDGYLKPEEDREPENSTPTTLEQWAADTFAPAFRGQAATA